MNRLLVGLSGRMIHRVRLTVVRPHPVARYVVDTNERLVFSAGWNYHTQVIISHLEFRIFAGIIAR